jgi:PTH2 family peptidyl-tRNA hydrolase
VLKPTNQTKDVPVKQVIVMRRDLKMRRGKQIAQGAHASMAFLLQEDKLEISDTLSLWERGGYRKVCVRVNSLPELHLIYDQAKAAGLRVHMIEDYGLTEFHGVRTETCLAIGPHPDDVIDPITGHLELL